MANTEKQNSVTWSNKKIIYSFVAGLIVGVLVTSFVGVARVDESGLGDTNASTENFATSLDANDQASGGIVYVSKASADVVSWVAVRENNNDVMGRILGAQKILVGEHENVFVELLRPTAPGVMYAVVMYKDNGDDIFDHKSDELVTDENGEVILSRFLAK